MDQQGSACRSNNSSSKAKAAAPLPAPASTKPAPIDTTTSWLCLEDETVGNLLLSAVGEVLGLEPESIAPSESFMNLGGTKEAATALKRACTDLGLTVRTEDILQCRDLADLESRVNASTSRSRQSSMSHQEILIAAPELQPPLPTTMPPAVAMAATAAAAQTQSPKLANTNLTTNNLAMLAVPEDARSTRSRRSSASSEGPRVQLVNEFEEIMNAEKLVHRVATIRPKAGILEGKFVALLTLATIATGTGPDNEIRLIPQAQAFFAGTQLASLKRVAESSLPPEELPEVWIALDVIPLNDTGDMDRRKLRTWVQNMNDDVYQRVLGLDIKEFMQAPVTEMDETLQRLVSKVLQLPQDQVGVNFSFSQLGGDEMLAMDFVARCKHEGIFLNASEVLEASTLSDLAALAAARGGFAQKWEDETADSFDLSPMQQLYFRTTLGGDLNGRAAPNGSYRFNQSMLLQLKKHYSFDDIAAAAHTVVGHHPMLRARFSRHVGKWTQRILPNVPNSFVLNQHNVTVDAEFEAIIANTQARIDIEVGPVFAVDYLSFQGGEQWLYLAAHHLAVDLASWRIIIHDLDELLENGSLLSQKSMPFQQWVELQKSEARGLEAGDVLPFEVEPSNHAYWGLENAPNTYGDALEASFSLSADLTTQLQTTCNQVFRTDTVDIYLAALMLSFAQTFNDRSVPAIWNQEHGRDHRNPDVDISETVGWFTTMCPISQRIESSEEFVDVLRRLKDLRRSIPAHGSQYFASKLLNGETPEFGPHECPFEIIFSCAGALQHLERENGVLEQMTIPGATFTSPTADIGPDVGRIALFEVSAMVDQGMAKMKILYSRQLQDQPRIAAWIHNFEHLLLDAINQLRYHPQELTLADVPHLDVTYEGLEIFNKQRLAALNLMSVRDIDAIYPVTAVEQSILVSQVQRSETCYLHAIYEFASPTGDPIDVSRICTAWQHVTLRHAALRTVFTESVSYSGLYDKVILRRASPEMLFIDTASGEDPIEELNNLPTLRSTDSKPNHRLTVCRAPAKTLVKLDISTALCDSLSIHLLIADLRRAYVTNKPIAETVQYSFPPYLEFLKAARQQPGLDFWRDQLKDVQPCLFPRMTLLKPDDRQRMANAYHEVDNIAAQDLATFARAQGTTIGALLRLAWGLILRAYTGSNKVCFGYQTIGRESAIDDIRHAVGSFANVVACHYDLSPQETLSSRFEDVDAQLTESLPYQHLTIEEIRHALGMRGGEHLFNTCLTFTEEPADLNSKFTRRTNFEIKSVSHQQTFDIDFAINTRLFNGRLAMDISQRIMTPEQAINLAGTFGRAVSAIITSPEGSVGGVNLFTDRDFARIGAWGNTSSKGEGQVRHVVHDLVSRNAVDQPDVQAVCAWDGDLTYKQLDEHATRLAHYLMDAGAGPHSIVPVVMDKCRLAPVAMLAVLKTGAAFVPLDAEELSLIQPIFDRLNSRLAVASDQAALVLSNLFDKVVVFNEDLLTQLPRTTHQRRSMLSIVTPDDVACLLFSPSVKDVRGVSFSHAALATTFLNQGPAAKITAESRVMQLSSFSVDIALSEIFTTLVQGGCVCIPSSTERLPTVERLQDFIKAMERMQVNWTYMTPILSRRLDPTVLPTLEVICFRTRSLDEDTYNPWHQKVTVVLAYGAQDVSPLGISFLEVTGPADLKTIGKPFAGSLWIINPDDHRKLVPVGAIGELVIEGPTLGWEYPHNELASSTREEQSLDLDAARRRTRYFKTGHRVRYTEGGLMEFLASKKEDLEMDGRVVNLTEIEQYLRRCLGQGVDVVVEALALKGEKNVPNLIAFVELGNSLFDGEEDLTELSATTKERIYIAKQLVETGLKNTLPRYLIPSIFIPVKNLPIRSSLKVNRRRLTNMINSLSKEQLQDLGQAPNTKNVPSIGLKPLPLTQNEERMRAIWARVLGVEDSTIGAADTFFRAGGDEVTATKLVNLCRREGINVSIGDVLGNATLTELSRGMVIAEECQEPYDRATSTTPSLPVVIPPNLVNDIFLEKIIAPKVGVTPQAIRDLAEASATQIRHIESGMLRGRANINYFTFHFTGSVNAKKLEEACGLLVETHPILRTAFVPHDRRVFQAVIKSFNAEFKKYYSASWRLTSLEEKVLRKDQSSPVAFASPMTKFMYLDAGKQSTLIMRLSRAQYDDLSMALLVKDLKRFYDGVENPPRRPNFCEFVRCAALENSQGADEYWKSLLDGAVMTQFVAHGKPYLVSTNVKTLRRPMPIGSLSNLGISFETVLKGAWAMVLASLSGTSDVVFGELIDGRHVRLVGGQSVAGVMGPTVNAIPVRVQFPESALSPLTLLQYVHAQRIAGIRYENLGFLHIVERCTQWPYWTRFSTVVQHQYEDTALNPREPKTFHLGSASCRFGMIESKAQDLPDLLVQSILRGTGRVELSVTYDVDRIPAAMGERALGLLCGAVNMLTSVNIMQPLVPSGYTYRALPKLIPLAPSTAEDAIAMSPAIPPPASGSASAPTSPQYPPAGLTAEKTKAIQDFIDATWTSLLNPRALGVPEDQIPNAAFYDLWGSLIPAAQLAAYMNRELPRLGLPGIDPNFKITMEDIVDNPTMAKQFDLIVRKLKLPGGGSAAKDKDKDKDGIVKTRARSASEGANAGGKAKAMAIINGNPTATALTLATKASNVSLIQAAQTQLQPQQTSQNAARKKPGVNISVGIGKSLRRLTSTVSRSTGKTTITVTPNSNNTPGTFASPTRAHTAPNLGVTPPVTTSISNPQPSLSPGADISPLTPNLSPGLRSPSSNLALRSPSAGAGLAPQLPNLPVFESITEEDEEDEHKHEGQNDEADGDGGDEGDGDDEYADGQVEIAVAMMAMARTRTTKRSTGNLSLAAESMTTSSTATDEDSDVTPGAGAAGSRTRSPVPGPGQSGGGSGGGMQPRSPAHPNHNPQQTTRQLQSPQTQHMQQRVATPPTVPTTPEIGSEEDVVSPMSPMGSAASNNLKTPRYFDKIVGGPGGSSAGGAAAAAASQTENVPLHVQRNIVLGQVGLSPISG